MAAERKPFFMSTEGFHEEVATTDYMTISKLTIPTAGSGGVGIVMNSTKVTGAGAATTSGDVLVYGQTSGSLGNSTTLGSTQITGTLDANNQNITNLPNSPSAGTSAVNKNYVDSVAQGLEVHPSCIALSNANITKSGLARTIDGVDIDTDGMRVLLTNQTSAVDNGIWIAHSGAWTRAEDMPTGYDAAGSFTFIDVGGTTYGATGWVCTAPPGTDIVGTHSLPWTQFAGAGTYTAGDGLLLTGTEFSVKLPAAPVKAELDLDTPSTNCDTVIEATDAGAAGNSITIAFVADGSGTGSFTRSGTALTFHFETAVTTVANFEAAVAALSGADDIIGVKTAGTGTNVLVTPGDVFSATNLASGSDGGSPALHFVSTALDVKYDEDRGLNSDTVGLYVKVDGSTITFDGSGKLQASAATSANDITLFNVIASGAVALADPVYWGANDKVAKGDAGVDAKSRIIGIALAAAADTEPTDVCAIGTAEAVLSGATVNTPYYLQDTGGIGTSLPGAGKRVIQIGVAKNATDLWVELKDFGKKAA